jgi:hydrogenase-4 component B
MDDLSLVFVALAAYGGTAAIAVLALRSPRLGSAIGSFGAIGAGAIGLFSALRTLARGSHASWRLANEVIFGGGIHAGVDSLSAFFLVPIFLLSSVAALYGRAYLASFERRRSLGAHWAAYNLVVASMVCVVIARDALSFLFAWEVMTLAAFVLVTFEHDNESVRRAGWVYLIASHIAYAALIAMFLLLSTETGGLSFDTFEAAKASSSAFVALIFALSIVGFGTKAGFYPLHVWLPEAHAAAPSHVSAVMSGVLIKLGIYGILRMFLLLRFSAAWWVLMLIGLLGGIIGISIALYQRDMKRILAYSSVENVGIITLGIGLGLFGAHGGNVKVSVLGFSGALFHVWNHTLMKGLMFLGAGSVLHGAHTKDLDRLGGVIKRMPWTGSLMIAGAVAISALPPMNAFAGEWLIYLGLSDPIAAGQRSTFMLFSIASFALLGALACFCFIRLVGIALLGTPRSGGAEDAHESGPSMIAAMIALLTLSIAAALFPAEVAALFSPAIESLAGDANIQAPIASVGHLNAAIWASGAVVAVVLPVAIKKRGVASGETWGCGYTGSSSRIQYVARSFSEMFAEHLLPKPFRARIRSAGDRPLFAPKLTLDVDETDPLTRGAYEPFLARWAERLWRFRWMQQGILHLYVVYILAIALIGVAWLGLRSWWQP